MSTDFIATKTEGALLTRGMIDRLYQGDPSLPGIYPESFHFASPSELKEEISHAWNRALELWRVFSDQREILPEGESGTRLTRDRWLLPLFRLLDYGRLDRAPAVSIDGKAYPVSHLYRSRFPVHLVSCRHDLDKRISGVTRVSAHAMVQELLNRTDDYLWACVSNGLTLRLLRDNVSLSRMSYVEFNLQDMFEGKSFADFRTLYLMLHQSRVEHEKPVDYLLEAWAKETRQFGTRALEHLRESVEASLNELGQGFLAHPTNQRLRQALKDGALSKQDYYHELLRLVYRLIFLLVAEDRVLLHDDDVPGETRKRYLENYSLSRIRKLSDTRVGSPVLGDLWECLKLTFGCVHLGQPLLGLKGLGSTLFDHSSTPHLSQSQLANESLLNAIRHLAYTRENNIRVAIDYRNLGAEELGSVYEGLLELHPEIHTDGAAFKLEVVAGSARKTTGSYYTPTELIECLLDSALDPVINQALRKPDRERAILDLKVCDPACGSGHFLVGAAHRIAHALASVRAGDDEPTPDNHREALREVISHCIYGVDLNPLAVELCRVALWMESIVPGKPLNFLASHIKCGNSLIGTTPELIEEGIPDGAYKPKTGDDKAFASEWKKKNKTQRKDHTGYHQEDLFADAAWNHAGNLAPYIAKLESLEDDTLESRAEKEKQYSEFVQSQDYLNGRLLADAWCAAFFWPFKESDDLPWPITSENLWRIERNPHDSPHWMRDQIRELAETHRFFHWHLEFPDIFNEHRSGFDCVLGNPPWERVKLQEKEFFATRSDEIANAPNAAKRRKLIAALAEADPSDHADRWQLWVDFNQAKHTSECVSFFLRASGRYPLTAVGDVNTYQVFCGLFRQIIDEAGRMGIIVPSGIATDNSNKAFFADITNTDSLISLYDFENREGVFEGVHRSYKFCLLTIGHQGTAKSGADFAFFLTNTNQLVDDIRHFKLTKSDIELLNPNTCTCPIFRSKKDAELTKYIYRRVPVLIDESKPDGNPWGIKFSTMFHMSNDSHLFRTAEELEAEGWTLKGNIFHKGEQEFLPLYEAKMFHHFNHRFGSYEDLPEDSSSVQLPQVPLERLQDPKYEVLPRYWVEERFVNAKLKELNDPEWLLAFRDICRNNDERTSIVGVLPRTAVSNKAPLIVSQQPDHHFLLALLCCFSFDYCARQKMGGTSMNFFLIKQFALPTPSQLDFLGDLRPLSSALIELAMVSQEAQFGRSLLGFSIPPFRWDEERRFLMRCELDAAFFHLYLGTKDEWKEKGSPELLEYFPEPRDAVEYIMETFPIVKRKDEKAYGHYRTKDQILQIYEAMQCAIETGIEYQTILDPPPGPPRDANGNFIPVDQWHTLDPHQISHIHPVDTLETDAPLPIAAEETDQVFPWTGRETAIYELIPQLVHLRPGMTYEYYVEAAFLCTHSRHLQSLSVDALDRDIESQQEGLLASYHIKEAQKYRLAAIRETLTRKQIVAIDPSTGKTSPGLAIAVEQLSDEHKKLLRAAMEAADRIEAIRTDTSPSTGDQDLVNRFRDTSSELHTA